MPKRKKFEKISNDDDTTDDETSKLTLPIIHKRRRRASDVIDSIGERDNYLPPGFYTPRRPLKEKIDVESPDQGYSATPESVNVFVPEWMTRKKSDILDAGLINPEIEEQATFSSSQAPSGLIAPMVIHKESQYYNMNHKNRGKCIVFNHEAFDTGFENRDGSTLDARRIERTFKNLGFSVEIFNNLKHGEVMDKITELSEENHEDNDCICIFMLTHGLAPDMIFAKDVAYKADNIWKPFTADKCTSLAGKPKLFFFQACRGNELDGGVHLHRNIAYRTETDCSITSYKLPTHADFLIAHSTVQGFYSWRNPEMGTWFVQCLCDVLDEYHETTDLLKMLTICARQVATEYASYNDISPTRHDQKQVPSITTMLIRDLYFLPK